MRGILYTLNGPVLKLTAQLLPVGDQYYEHRPTTREQGPEPTLDVLYRLTILGDRQERFLAGWAAADPGSPKICFSQTLWGCLQTDERGRAQFDADADAAVAARRTALELVKRCNQRPRRRRR